MKLKSIYIDGLHNAVNKQYTFGDIVYIFGHNGAGKSTILQAIQFTLLGYIPGTAKNSREAFLRHSPKGEITVKLTIVDDNHSIVVIERKINKVENRITTVPENYDISAIISDIEVPIFNFNDFVNQTANKLKEYFIKNILPTTQGQLNWEQILSSSIADCNFTDKQEILDYGMSLIANLEGEVLDQVIEANANFKTEQSFNKSELQRLQNTIDSMIFYDDYVGPSDTSEINAELLSLGALRDQIIRYTSAAAATRSANEELDKLRNNLASLGSSDDYGKMQEQLAEYKTRNTEYNRIIAEYRDKISGLAALNNASESIINSKGICPYTKETCQSIANKIADIQIQSNSRKSEIDSINAEILSLTSKQTELQSAIRQLELGINDIRTILNRIATIENTLTELPQKPDTDKKIEDLDREIETLTQAKAKLQANIQYNSTIDNITKLKYEAELRGTALANWVKKTDTNGLQTTLMQKPFEELATKMTGYIRQMYGNDSLKAHFNLSTKANSFSFGLIRDNIYIPYDLLSSGEKCLYTLALMICITHNSKSPLKLLLCDDMFDHLDSNAIENTFDTLKKLPGIQFIFAGVKDCKNAQEIMLRI